MSIPRIGAQAPHFGALVATKVNYQPEDQIVTTVTRRKASGANEKQEQTENVPFQASIHLKATENADQDYPNISGLTGKDPVSVPVSVELSITPNGHFKLDS